MAIDVKVVCDGSAGEALQVQAEVAGDVAKARELGLRGKDRGRKQPLRRHLMRVFPKGHVSDIEKPWGVEDFGAARQNICQLSNGRTGTLLVFVDSGRAKRHQ